MHVHGLGENQELFQNCFIINSSNQKMMTSEYKLNGQDYVNQMFTKLKLNGDMNNSLWYLVMKLLEEFVLKEKMLKNLRLVKELLMESLVNIVEIVKTVMKVNIMDVQWDRTLMIQFLEDIIHITKDVINGHLVFNNFLIFGMNHVHHYYVLVQLYLEPLFKIQDLEMKQVLLVLVGQVTLVFNQAIGWDVVSLHLQEIQAKKKLKKLKLWELMMFKILEMKCYNGRINIDLIL